MFFPFALFEHYLRSLVYTCGKNTGPGTVLGEIEVVCDCVATMNELRVFRRSCFFSLWLRFFIAIPARMCYDDDTT